MKYSLYVIFDRLAGNYSLPFADFNDASAIRTFNAKDFGKFEPTDFELYRIGEYDCSTSELLSLEKQFVCRGVVNE